MINMASKLAEKGQTIQAGSKQWENVLTLEKKRISASLRNEIKKQKHKLNRRKYIKFCL